MTRAAALPLEETYESKDGCAVCGVAWVSAPVPTFVVLVALGDGLAHVIHHDCPDPAGRVWRSEPAPLVLTGSAKRRPKWTTRPRTEGLEDEITAAVEIIRAAALAERQMTAGAWRIACDQAGISEQARSDALRRAVTVLHLLEIVDIYGGRLDLADIDKRTPVYRSLIFVEPDRPRGVDRRAGKPRF